MTGESEMVKALPKIELFVPKLLAIMAPQIWSLRAPSNITVS
jgi:hypothetical protein